MSVKPPSPRNQDHGRYNSGPRYFRDAIGRRAECVRDMDRQQQHHIRDESITADAILGPRRLHAMEFQRAKP